MKILKITLFLAIISCFTFSCGNDDDSSGDGNQQLANEQNELEDAPVALEDLNSGISIDGATKNDGTPPQPNSNLDLAVSSNTLEAVQQAGFNLKFSSSEAVAGAYLQFQDADNTSASNYFDIPVSNLVQNKGADTKAKKGSKSGVFSKVKSTTDGEYEIDVDFDDSFPPGNFCGVLCIYDSENNISQPITVCVVVEAWGGNATLVGTWKITDIDEGDETVEISCTGGGTLTAPYDEVLKQDIEITFDSNGDFESLQNEEYKELDWETSADDCTAVYYSETSEYDSKETGKWAFNEDDDTLTIVSFAYEDFIENYTEDYPDGELVLERASVEFVGGKLIITETFTELEETYTVVYTFERVE